ncbi:MAG: [FeFe] hydrogenase H-cluster radical SAM maturase HydE [Candidatus Cloacimonetes bacterium]|nr:[FeFe] hydrogenase H-cluster radical SAM maturase HydE [Candidatus Cloacimonadota bacterium]
MFTNDIELLQKERDLPAEKLADIIEGKTDQESLFHTADSIRQEYYGKDVYIRGLIEITNICRNNCYYCGIRCDNTAVQRYSLSIDEILQCCRVGHDLGFRTFVLQGGEAGLHSEEFISETIRKIKANHPYTAITLSIGERTYDEYLHWFEAGADRYLLRHETANSAHYKKLHPENLSLENRKKCLWDLKQIGYQVGSGFMVGSPFQTTENLIEDLRFLQELQPDMIGIGPFISHKNTPFFAYPNGDFQKTLRLIAILRLIFPYALIPSTTALGTIDKNGREMGIKAGANVVMPNLSPIAHRKEYELYDHKICTDEEAAESIKALEKKVSKAGYQIVTDIGHVSGYRAKKG